MCVSRLCHVCFPKHHVCFPILLKVIHSFLTVVNHKFRG